MKMRAFLWCMLLVITAGGPALAGVENQWYGGDRVVYDATNDLYYYPFLTDLVGMTRAQQQWYITAQINNKAYGFITDWKFATYDQVSALKDSLVAMGTDRVEHEFPWTPPGAPRTMGSPFLAWPVQVDAFFTPTSVMTQPLPGVPMTILKGLPMQVFNGRMTGWAWRTGAPGTPPSWEFGQADDHFVTTEYNTPGAYATVTFNYDVHLYADDATDRDDFPGPSGAWVVSETGPFCWSPAPLPAPMMVLEPPASALRNTTIGGGATVGARLDTSSWLDDLLGDIFGW